MLLLCDNSVAVPLKIIYQNILASSTCPDLRKHGNVTPIFKKGDKQLIKNYKPIFYSQFVVKYLKTLSPITYTAISMKTNLLQNQSGFRPGDSIPC